MFNLKELLVVMQTNEYGAACTATTCTCTATGHDKHDDLGVDNEELKLLEAALDSGCVV